MEKAWTDNGGEIASLSAADIKKLMDETAPIGPAVVAAKPELKEIYDALSAAAKKARM
jgi:hypothetical protein